MILAMGVGLKGGGNSLLGLLSWNGVRFLIPLFVGMALQDF